MTPRRIVVAGFFNFSLAIFAVLFGALQQADNIPGLGWFDPFDIDFWTNAASGIGLDAWVIAHQWLTAVGGLIIVLVLGIATGIIRMAMTNWDFRLERGERGFRRTRGLTTRTDAVIPISRIQAAMVVSGIIRRGFGWFELKLQSLGADSKQEADHQVAPLARLAEVDILLDQIGLNRAGYEDYAGSSADLGSAGRGSTIWHRSHPVMIWVTPVVLGVAAAVLLAVLLQVRAERAWLAAFPAASGALVGLVGWFDWRHRRWHFDGVVLHIVDGFLRQRHIILPARNIQSADIEIGPITRRLALASLRLGVPGGRAGQHHIVAIPLAEAQGLRSRLLAQR